MKNFLAAAAGLFLWVTAGAQNLSVSTNLLDCLELGTLNLEASCGIGRRWTVNAGVKYNPFSYGSGKSEFSSRQRSFDAGARFWPWHIYSGWWLGGKLRYQEYSRGGFSGPRTREGDRYGGGVSGGYSFMLTPFMNLDLGVGLWGGFDRYTVYECQRCGSVAGGGGEFFLLPNDILVTIAFIF
ncbi:MAG: DUF3575 domain-containing protein [Bacteroidales bacterium]|nr:DUF3575 domain-containing protein [Bacteroidales bacterium]